MKITITTLEELGNHDLSSMNILEDLEVDIRLRLEDEEIEYPINIIHTVPGKSSKVFVKLALFGKSKVKMPVEIKVESGATQTSTDFKALVLLASPRAQAQVTPGLLIHEKDIQSASHGVVIKNIKEKDLVYLRARGLTRELAREALVQL